MTITYPEFTRWAEFMGFFVCFVLNKGGWLNEE
jgi:hypothetical protein